MRATSFLVGAFFLNATPAWPDLTYKVLTPNGLAGAYGLTDSGWVAVGSRHVGVLDLPTLYRDGQYVYLTLPQGCDHAVCKGVAYDGTGFGDSVVGGQALLTKWTAGAPAFVSPPQGYTQVGVLAADAGGDFLADCKDGYVFHHALLWTSAGVRDVTAGLAMGNTDVQSATLSSSTQVAGNVAYSGWEGFSWSNGKASMLPKTQGADVHTLASSVNLSGTIVGSVSSQGASRAAKWEAGIMSLIPYGSRAASINDRAQVLVDGSGVNVYSDTKGYQHIRPDLANIQLTRGVCINNKGWILAFGTGAAEPAFLLAPESSHFTPVSFSVQYGTVSLGGLKSLQTEDGDYLRIKRDPSHPAEPVRLSVDGVSPVVADNLWYTSKLRCDRGARLSVRVNFFDWKKGVYDSNSVTVTTTGGSWSVAECVAKGDLARFVRASDRRVRVLVRVAPAEPLVGDWSVDLDVAGYEVVQ